MIEKLGPYHIDKLLGRGGMGSVYSGQHEETGELAAIKVLSIVLADDGNFRDRFITEIETLKKLHHPNIVRLYGEGEQDGYLFYVMELVEGKSLQVELQAGTRYSWQEVVEIAIQICAALRHAHDRGVIHRDLKPANLLRTPDGIIKLTDFGIAKLFGGTQLTADGSVVGTADYMSPEQAEGKPVTNRTDLYSLGGVMFTLLCRRPPFTAPSVAQVIHKLLYDQPPSVRKFASTVPVDLALLLEQLLQKDPQDRLPNALVLSNRLQQLRQPSGEDGSEVDDGGEPYDLPTLASHASPPTEASPTVADDTSQHGESGGYSWNDATVVTSDDDAAEPASAAPLSGRDTVANTAPDPPPNRFTTVEEDALSGKKTEGEESRQSHLQTALLAVALVAVVALGIWWAVPPDADTLYEQIMKTVATAGPVDAKKQIDRFLVRFPDDERAVEILSLQRDVESEWLQSRLALRELKSGGAQLELYEQMWLEAMRQRLKQPVQARAVFAEIEARYGSQEGASESLQQILAATRHQLARLAE